MHATVSAFHLHHHHCRRLVHLFSLRTSTFKPIKKKLVFCQIIVVRTLFDCVRICVTQATPRGGSNAFVAQGSHRKAMTTGSKKFRVSHDIISHPNQYRLDEKRPLIPGPRAGSGWFCDGFAVANYMKKEFPRDFDILRQTKIQFSYANENNFDCVHWDSLIK